MRKGLFFFSTFFILGLTSIIGQVLLLRELMVTFYGNEIFLGLALGFWLLGTAGGAFLGQRFPHKNFFFINLFILALLLPLTLTAIRFAKTFFPPGVLIDFPKAIGLTLLFLVPLGASLGFFFVSGLSCFSSKHPPQLASKAYLIEILGFCLGGLLVDLFLIKLPSLFVILSLSFVNLGFCFLFSKRKKLALISLLLFAWLLAHWSFFEEKTSLFQFPNLVEEKNSAYGRISVTRSNGQYNFFESGALVDVSQKTEDSEYLVHPLMLEHPNPQKVLLIGGGLGGELAEILKHHPQKLSYVELDPLFVQTVKKYLHPKLRLAAEDPRVELVFVDPRKFLKETQEKYDLVILNLPLPSTALINRLYTQEAFGEIKAILAPKGILALNLSLPTDYLSEESKNLAASIYQTLKQEFKQILLLPEYSLLFLASNQPVLTEDAQVLAKRLSQRQIETEFVSPAYLQHRLTNDRRKMFSQVLTKGGRVNSDFFPIAYFFQTAFWQSYFSFGLGRIFTQLAARGIIFLILLLGGLSFLIMKNPKTLPAWAMALAGAAIMIWEVVIIFAFQVKLGYIYQKISLLLAAVLLGMALGNWLANKNLKFEAHLRPVLLLMVFFSLILPLLLAKTSLEWVFFLLGGSGGVLGGTIFPLVCQAEVKKKEKVGMLYGADLLGSFGGALLASLFLIPVFGLHFASFSLIIPFLAILIQLSLL